jgi:hypothetical protein
MWQPGQWMNNQVEIVGGTGKGQIRPIVTNDATTLSVVGPWTVVPDNTSQYLIRSSPGSVWVSWTSLAGGGHQVMADGSPVRGLGTIGPFIAPDSVTGSQDATFADIKVGPQGEVVVSYQTDVDVSGMATVKTSLDPDGLGPKGFTDKNGAMPRATLTTHVGWYYSILAQPGSRGIDAEASLAWDRSGITPPGPAQQQQMAGRLYLAYTDANATNHNDAYIAYAVSTDDGATWSALSRSTTATPTASSSRPSPWTRRRAGWRSLGTTPATTPTTSGPRSTAR